MFSGIIEGIGQVVLVDKKDESGRLEIESDLFLKEGEPSRVGDSVSVSGVCLTLTDINRSRAKFDLSTETKRKTTLGELKVGSLVNLERALKVGAGLHGHFVLGHVDGIIAVSERKAEQNTVCFGLTLPRELRPFIAKKGAIALDGVSLTVGEVEHECFSVYVIPYTLAATTLARWTVGDRINVEVDVIARYLYQLMQSK